MGRIHNLPIFLLIHVDFRRYLQVYFAFQRYILGPLAGHLSRNRVFKVERIDIFAGIARTERPGNIGMKPGGYTFSVVWHNLFRFHPAGGRGCIVKLVKPKVFELPSPIFFDVLAGICPGEEMLPDALLGRQSHRAPPVPSALGVCHPGLHPRYLKFASPGAEIRGLFSYW